MYFQTWIDPWILKISKKGNLFKTHRYLNKKTYLNGKVILKNYVKSIDQDLWHIISFGDFKPKKTSFENQDNYLELDKNTKAKTMIYKALVPNMKECIFVKRLMIFGKIC
jgi:alpha-D-ribose 1-methylphosphonate 5-triphosphate diphosphatase PhnM